MQKSILSFIGKKEIYPTVFYLNYTNTEHYSTEYLYSIPLDAICIGKIKWNYSKNDLHIYIHKKLHITNNNKYEFTKAYSTNNVSLLKSQLQKIIRRKLNNMAINIAYQFINLDLNEFLRRLLIITLEDVILNSYFPVLAWMMVAYSTNKWSPTKDDINWLLNYVDYLCNIDYREAYGKIDETTPAPTHINSFYNSLIFSMELRKSYGGMKGDMKFINWYIQEWNNRFTNNITQYINTLNIKMTIKTIDLNMELIKPVNMLKEGVDFHNYPQILENIHKFYPKYNLEDIKKSIWEFSSKYNKRNFINDRYPDLNKEIYIKLENIWNKIKEKKNELTHKYLLQNTL